MEWLISNWYLLLALIAVAVMIVVTIMRYLKLPTAQQIANLKEWLKLAVIEAEKELGSGTGQLKLRMVYDMAVARFSWLGSVVKFETFKAWVDEALEWMNSQLENNTAVNKFVEEKR